MRENIRFALVSNGDSWTTCNEVLGWCGRKKVSFGYTYDDEVTIIPLVDATNSVSHRILGCQEPTVRMAMSIELVLHERQKVHKLRR